MTRITTTLFSIALFLSPLLQAKENELIISTQKQQKMRFGIDYERLWYWGKNLNDEERKLIAKWSLTDTGVDYVRVAINSKYEMKEGQLDPKAYTSKILPMMKVMQAENPKIKFFASPRPHNEADKKAHWAPYPQWVTGDIHNKRHFDLDTKKCAEYLLRYFDLMRKNDLKISFLDITNEWQSTSDKTGRLTGEDVKEIKAYLKAKLPPSEMPLIIGPSSWNYSQGGQWLKSLSSSEKSAIDIASSHNTDRTGTAAKFAERARQALGTDTEIWNTELHGWKSTSKEKEVTSFHYMLETINAGFSGINGWLALGTKNQGHSYILNPKGKPTRNVKYFLFQKLSSTSNYGHALEIIQEPKQLSHTTALIKDNLLTVWAINQTKTEAPINIIPKGHRLLRHPVSQTTWTNPEDVEGHTKNIDFTNTGTLPTTIPPHSVSCFEIQLRP
ncbi:MAG: hypothetical protein ACSHX6_01835 [Akkermansiaceae bacterium]